MQNKSETLEKMSKTQLKKEATELRELGRDLTSFPPSDLDQLELNPKLRAAIDDFKRLPNSHGAKKRQLQYIGRLIRERDGKMLQTKIHRLNSSLKQQKQLKSTNQQSTNQQSTNQLFERIISEGDSVITEIAAKQQQLERQKLRQLKNNILKAKPEKRALAESKLRAYIKLANN